MKCRRVSCCCRSIAFLTVISLLFCFPSTATPNSMLFLGTQKYPGEDDYETFLSQAGGYSNAYTDMEDTNYYFSVTTAMNNGGSGSGASAEDSATGKNSATETMQSSTTTPQLAGALDRFAQFFIRPTFDPDAVERELRAIDSEYRNSKTSDQWRGYQLLKACVDQKHPFSKFGCGNYDTLSSASAVGGFDKLLGELERFWSTHYQTYNLRLAVVGHASLDALQKTVEDTFGHLPYSEGTPRRAKQLPNQKFQRENAVYNVTAWGPDQLGKINSVIPLQESRSVKLYFATPPMEDAALRSSKPHRAFSHVLGHESPGSLHALLNAKGYINGLSSGIGLDVSDFSMFSLSLSLTPKGMQAQQEVLDLAFQWIAMLKENQDQLPLYHEELRQITTTNFRFQENGDATDFCSAAAELLFDDDENGEQKHPERFLIAPGEVTDFDPDVARAFLDRLRPDNCLITIINSDLNNTSGDAASDAAWQTEPWYGATYKVAEITEEQKKAWEFPSHTDERLQMPALNNYIPTDFSLRSEDAGAITEQDEPISEDLIEIPPTLLIDRPNLRLWHKMDRYWRVPKTLVRLAILSPNVYRSPRSMTLNRIFQRVLKDDLNSYVYDASIAGCSVSVSCAPNGYRISARGYSEKVPFLLETLTTRILSLIDEMKQGDPVLREKFAKAKESLLRETKNYRLDTPYEVASYNSRLLLEENVFYLDNYIDEMEGPDAERDPLTMEECAQQAEESVTGRLKCEALCMGNIDEKGALEISNVIDRHFLDKSRILSEVETPRFRTMKLPTREEARHIFGAEAAGRTIPLVYQDLAFSETEENNAVEFIIQAGCELDLGYEGVAILDLITNMAYTSSFGQLRTKEQLGYIVSAFARKTAGSTWGMSIVVQSSVALPEVLEDRIEKWLVQFRQELEDMSPESIATEASAVIAQLLESETKLSQEANVMWGEILSTEGLSERLRTPSFDRLKRLVDELIVSDESSSEAEDGGKVQSARELKDRVTSFFDKYMAAASPNRRVMSSRVYNHTAKAEYEAALTEPGVLSTFEDVRHFKQYLSSWPTAPYWRVDKNVTDTSS
jgi:insulysin